MQEQSIPLDADDTGRDRSTAIAANLTAVTTVGNDASMACHLLPAIRLIALLRELTVAILRMSNVYRLLETSLAAR